MITCSEINNAKHFRFQSPFAIDRLMIDTCTYHTMDDAIDVHVFLLPMIVCLCTVPTVPICLCMVTMMTDEWLSSAKHCLLISNNTSIYPSIKLILNQYVNQSQFIRINQCTTLPVSIYLSIYLVQQTHLMYDITASTYCCRTCIDKLDISSNEGRL